MSEKVNITLDEAALAGKIIDGVRAGTKGLAAGLESEFEKLLAAKAAAEARARRAEAALVSISTRASAALADAGIVDVPAKARRPAKK